MKTQKMKVVLLTLFMTFGTLVNAQSADEEVKKAKEWISSLALNDKTKEDRLVSVVATHLTAVKNWHNSHPAETVPAGINPLDGKPLSDLHRQIIADSAMPSTVHQDLMNGLRKDLTEEQVAQVLDKYTIGKVAFTMKGYQAIVPNMTAAETAEIQKLLEKAREQAVDYKSMKQISAIFEIYKTQAEQYLNNNGRNWRQMYADYTKKIKAEKEAKQKK
ncbi:DUF3826 domain-containing protein [Flavobacterium seoulense]|uniref:DUF3826 domain-containing protein n=1 Tax=Flavobacterium seoulense TaxID=1492738 RepID=A0A066WZ51_9FLAO|nr:DUF3826 domain-containing protein [Flavobacterium seoulense]KDN56214.1 hypothetical protein FEM21_07660 [Flavobacterium seoulense]